MWVDAVTNGTSWEIRHRKNINYKQWMEFLQVFWQSIRACFLTSVVDVGASVASEMNIVWFKVIFSLLVMLDSRNRLMIIIHKSN